MANESPAVPVTWRELRAPDRGASALDGLRSLRNEFASPRVNEVTALGTSFSQVAAAVVIGATAVVGPLIGDLRSGIELGVRAFNDLTEGGALVRLGFISALAALECGGFTPEAFWGAAAPAALDTIVEQIKDLSEPLQHSAGLAAIGVGKTALVPRCVGGGKLPAKIKPGQTFQFNVPGFVRYMAVAADKGASAGDVEPAWLDFVSAFPHKLAAETLDWHDLLWAARIYYHGFEKRPVAEVAPALRELVSSL